MSQNVPEKKAVRNTNKADSQLKGRAWCFTLNNYMESEVNKLQSDAYSYLFQEEKGENGTPHLQGVIKFKEPVRFSAVKKLNCRAHWELCKNYNASLNYCSKEETLDGERYTNIKKLIKNVPSQKKKRDPDLEKILFEQELEDFKRESLENADLSCLGEQCPPFINCDIEF